MTQEEKAKAYDEALATARRLYNMRGDWTNLEIESIFPELKESKDERIRKEIIDFCTIASTGQTSVLVEDNSQWNRWLAWLEKQGEKKPADKVEPKFHHGDRVRNKRTGVTQILGSCIEDVYEGAFPFRIKDQDDWELVEQNPTWSEEDNTFFKAIIRDIENIQYISEDAKKDRINWLKSLKERLKGE